MTDDEARRRAVELIQAGGELGAAGAATGAGFLVGGPVGAAGGAFVGALVKIGADFGARRLSEQQRVRVGTALAAADTRAWHRIMDGDRLRTDGFFEASAEGVSRAEEVGDAVLLAAANESEQRKVSYMGNLLANIAFESTVDAASAHDLITEAQELSYAQLVMVSIVAGEKVSTLPSSGGGTVSTLSALTARRQLEDLGYARRELIGVKGPEHGLPTNLSVPNAQQLSPRGRVLYTLMELGRIPPTDVDETLELLRLSYREE